MQKITTIEKSRGYLTFKVDEGSNQFRYFRLCNFTTAGKCWDLMELVANNSLCMYDDAEDLTDEMVINAEYDAMHMGRYHTKFDALYDMGFTTK